jgi:hypothetical protein
MIKGGTTISEASWANVEAHLPFLLGGGGIATYHALVADLVAVQDDDGIQRILETMLHNAGLVGADSVDSVQVIDFVSDF